MKLRLSKKDSSKKSWLNFPAQRTIKAIVISIIHFIISLKMQAVFFVVSKELESKKQVIRCIMTYQENKIAISLGTDDFQKYMCFCYRIASLQLTSCADFHYLTRYDWSPLEKAL